jgi:hypothetical protein
MTQGPRPYICVLRWKAGERAALTCVAPQVAASLIPIIEPTPRAFERATERADLFRATLRETARQVGLAWAGRPFLFDPHLIRPAAIQLSLDPDAILAAESLTFGLRGSPVFRLSTPATTAKRILADLPLDVPIGVRIHASDLDSAADRSRLTTLLGAFGLQPRRVQLIVDLGVVDSDEPPTKLFIEIPHLRAWRGVTMLGGSFPPNLIDLELGMHNVPRFEWRKYRHMIDEWPAGLPAPGFGDFGTQHAEFREPVIPCFPSLSVRYACNDDWLVLRGSSYKNKDAGGSRQFIGHARFLAQQPYFSGAAFSAGDQYIIERTLPEATPGNHQTWLSASMNHHLTLTAWNLAAITAQPITTVASGDYPRLASVLQNNGVHQVPAPAAP